MKIESIQGRLKSLSSQEYALCLVVSILFFFLSVRHLLLTESLTMDEIIAWNWLNEPWSNLWTHIFADTQGPVYLVLTKLIHSVFPLKNDYWLRAPSLAIGTVIFFCWAYLWSRRYFEKPLILVLLILLLGFNPLFRYAASYARYSILLFALASYLAMRISDQIRQNRVFSVSIWDVIAAGLLENTHLLGAIWLGTCLVAMFLNGVKVQWGKNAIGKVLVLLCSTALFACFFYKQLPGGENLGWNMGYREKILAPFIGVFGGAFPLWIFLILLRVSRKYLDLNFKVFITQASLILLTFCLGLFCSVNLFVCRYFIVLVPNILILQEEVFVWCGSLKLPGKMGQNWVQVLVILLALNIGASDVIVRAGPKQILYGLKDKYANSTGQDDLDRVACILHNGETQTLASYSAQYFKKDICSVYLQRPSESLDKMKYLLIFDGDGDGTIAPLLPRAWVKTQESGDRNWVLFEKAEL